MRILEGEGVRKYFGGLAALHNVNFNINQGEAVGLIGPNGAGKTTLFNLISGSLPATAGEIRYKGKKITGLKPYQICKKGVARTFQSAQLFAGLTVFENALAASLFGKKRAISVPDAEKEAKELLEFVGLSTVGAVLARDLPVANQKRLEVARALATKPELLLFDEVMAGLNPTEMAQAMELITKIRNKGITLFMIEHVMKAIMKVCDRIIVLHHGSKIAEGTPEEIATNRTVVEVYLGE
ncbi:MAG TPA: ABC transporter ATP-binding protein [Desulfatiglandales bacterium]|nr:ABC transporter ATP-binding protein [Desulfatiglandales bacterium]